MIVTGAFLAQSARVSEGMLDVWGGVVTSWTRLPGQPATPVLVVLTQAEEVDTTEAIPFAVFANGNQVVSDSIPVPAITRSGGDAGFFFHQLVIMPQEDVRAVIVVGSDATGSVSLPLTIQTAS